MSKYKNPVGSKAYYVEKQMAYLDRKTRGSRIKKWQAVLARVLELEMQGLTYDEIAEQLLEDNKFIIRERKGE